MTKVGSSIEAGRRVLRSGTRVTVGGLIGVGILASFIAAKGDTKEAGKMFRSAVAEDVAPGAGKIAIGAARYIGLDSIGTDDLPELNISTGDSGGEQVGSLAVSVSGVSCDAGTYSLNRGSLGAYAYAGLTTSEAYTALEQHPEVQAAAAQGAQTLTVSCN